MTSLSSVICDVCSQPVRKGSGYILFTGDVVSSSRYWEQNFNKIREMGGNINMPMVLRLASEMSQKYSPWIICDRCVDLFDADRAEARRRATKYWSTGQAPSGTVGDQDAAMAAALKAFTKTRDGGFPLEWPTR